MHGQQTNTERLPVILYAVANLKVKSQNAPGLVMRFLVPFKMVIFMHALKVSVITFSFSFFYVKH